MGIRTEKVLPLFHLLKKRAKNSKTWLRGLPRGGFSLDSWIDDKAGTDPQTQSNITNTSSLHSSMPTKKTTTNKKARAKATKKAEKKSTKRAPKKSKKQPLVHAAGDQCFWVSGGPILSTLVDLERALSEMDEALYKYHATGEQNDFAEWVEHVLSDPTCAKALRKARKPGSAATVIKRRLTVYEL